jgi:hypothetical protein
MAPQITNDVVAPTLHYEITNLWNGEPIPQSQDHKINAQVTLQSKKKLKNVFKMDLNCVWGSFGWV